ncbi:sushi, von Willebrand factor type A, EGF and pentraxin domain-containing protein 1-like [Ostrea edulis]|uniref:sushi, von Willebrand factor type A, EGF and pentraxin domain-containing protein 1-like n=1 Tax=Ostrea edulis TaxID=37623 RepID=UPI0024AF1CDB|nr:sushi, von Willebrand factor type A, EGF and pentraxin domain-containing protein 1-like [Ostrea edulis]
MARSLIINTFWILFMQFILIVKGFKPEDTACDVFDLEPGRVLRCTDKDNIPVTAASEVPPGSTCDIICPYKEVKAWVTCDDGKWNDYYLTYCKEALTTQNSRLSRPKRWFRFRRIFRAIGRFFRCLFGCSRRRDNTPPSLRCPQNIHKIAEKLQTWTVATWVEPTANDGRDGGITPTREGKASGSYFSSGVTAVGYYARDRSGNMARCTFTITVTVVRCPWPSRVSNGYFICHPSDDARYGATCRFGCYPGYQLVGNTQLECLVTGHWNHIPPHCEKITCPVLPPPVGNLNYVCTDDNKFRSICTYACTAGYDITPGMSRVRVCTAYGMWRGAEPTCTDIEPPKLQGCMHTVYGFADRNSTTGVVTWREPTALDNHDAVVNVVKVGSVSPGDRLPAGSYKIIYKATDAAGNQAQTCKTEIAVKVLKCPVVYPTPFLSVTCPWGTKYGSQCEFNCDPGSVRNGSKIVVCEKSGSGNYGYWTWGDRQPYCQVIQKCIKEPNVPQNGALACDYWLGGKFCQMLCKSGYDVQLGQSFVDMLVCGDSGQWLPAGSLPLPDCAESRLPRRGKIPMSATYYFTGDCTDLAVQDKIKEKFIQTLSASVFKDACLIHAKDCNVENVQVKCGQIARRKRSIDGTLRIYFDIAAKFDDATFNESFTQFRRHQSEIIDIIIESKTTGTLDFNISQIALMEATDIDNLDVVLECPENTIPSYKTTSCVECPEGAFYNKATQTCEMCSRGKYQPSSGQSYCLSCPLGQTTRTTGTHFLSQCEEGCEPGSWSPNGTPECSLCMIGTFSDSYGASQCTPCPGSKSTTEEGSISITQCQDFDLRMTEVGSEASAGVAVPFSIDTIITFWLQRETFTGNDFRLEIVNVNTGTLTFYLAFGAEIKIGKQGYENTTNYISDNERWHSYVIKHGTDSTELYVDGRLEAKSYLAIDFRGNMTVSLKGRGTVSGLNIWNMNSTTFTLIMNKSQKCNTGELGDLVSWKAFELASNDNVFKQAPSECDDVNDCLSNPCLNGDCIDLLGGHECHCYFGFYGDNCEENIDDCIDHACENNATCVDGAANYTCQCQYGYKGELCEIAMVDGSWGDWGEWSSCSVTCGNGTQQRSRICNDPAPDNGGLDCPDNSTESQICNETKCPECSSLERLDNVIWTCTNDSDNINCTIDCAAGYDFDHEIKPYYLCGIDTFYLWDFQTDDNPDRKMPSCSEIKDSKKLQVSYVASYKDLECDTSIKYKDTHKFIPEAVQLGLNNIECVSTGVCFLDRVTVTECNQRQKRSTVTSNAGVDVSLSCDPAVHGTETCYTLLYAAVNDIQLMAMNQTLDVDIQGSIYKIDPDSASADGTVSCPTGMVQMKFYCIPCAPGRYFRDNECLVCDFGTYQDRSGQLSCKECPDGTTTPGRESRSVTECSVKVDTSANESIPIIAGVLISVLVLTIVVISTIVFRRYLHQSNKKKDMVSSSILNIQSRERKFVSKTSFDRVQLSRTWESPSKQSIPSTIKDSKENDDIDVIYLEK